VYQFDEATDVSSGSLTSDAVFALAAANADAEGIADPRMNLAAAGDAFQFGAGANVPLAAARPPERTDQVSFVSAARRLLIESERTAGDREGWAILRASPLFRFPNVEPGGHDSTARPTLDSIARWWAIEDILAMGDDADHTDDLDWLDNVPVPDDWNTSLDEALNELLGPS
jgi:hypothetical protein